MSDLIFYKQSFDCPLCGHKNIYQHFNTPQHGKTEIIYCDMDSGGCDQQIVLKVQVETRCVLTAHKIEGLNY